MPEESLSELRRKYLRKKPLYGRAPSKKAFVSGSTFVKYTYNRGAEALMLLSSLILGFIFMLAPVTDGWVNYSVFDFLFGNSVGIARAVEALTMDSTFSEFLTTIRALGVCITLIVGFIDVTRLVFKAIKAFFTKDSSMVKMCTVGIYMNLFSVFIWMALFGSFCDLGNGGTFDLYMSDPLSTAIIVAYALTTIAGFISLGKGFSEVPHKKACWWSSSLLTTVYAFIAFTMIKLNVAQIAASAAGGFGMIYLGYEYSNTTLECILIGIFNCFLLVTFFILKKHVTSTLYSEMGCVLGFGKGYVKTAPYPSTRVKAAICPAIAIFASAVLASEQTGIYWPVNGTATFVKITIALVIAAIICKATFNKTRNNVR